MKTKPQTLNLFEYTDYRQFLKDWYENAKAQRASFSHRAFAMKAGFKTSNFLMLVVQSKRNLTDKSLAKMIKGLGLNKQESEFFENLVLFNQAKTHDDKNVYYQRLLQSKKFRNLKPIAKQNYQYYSTWYHPVVRELVVSHEFDGTPEWISQKLNGAVSPTQCTKSIELLERLGFIKKDAKGKWQQEQSILSTGQQLTSLVVHNYHKSILDLTRAMMDQLTMEHREVTTMTLGVPKTRISEIRQKIKNFRKEILAMVANDVAEDVVQLNIQLFPVTTQKPNKK